MWRYSHPRLTFCAAAIICLAKTNTLAALTLGSCVSHTCETSREGGGEGLTWEDRWGRGSGGEGDERISVWRSRTSRRAYDPPSRDGYKQQCDTEAHDHRAADLVQQTAFFLDGTNTAGALKRAHTTDIVTQHSSQGATTHRHITQHSSQRAPTSLKPLLCLNRIPAATM